MHIHIPFFLQRSVQKPFTICALGNVHWTQTPVSPVSVKCYHDIVRSATHLGNFMNTLINTPIFWTVLIQSQRDPIYISKFNLYLMSPEVKSPSSRRRRWKMPKKGLDSQRGLIKYDQGCSPKDLVLANMNPELVQRRRPSAEKQFQP